MIRGAFQHRSGRVIAVGRAIIATFFLIAIWLDHSQPAVAVAETYMVLGAYALASGALLLLTWNNWWLESHLAAPAHAVDLLVLLWINFATQGYASPFFTFFVFLVLAASIRWGWRGTAATAVVIFPLYIASALTAVSWGTEAFEWRRFAIRTSYLVVLSSMMILWLVTQRPIPPEPRLGRIGRERDRSRSAIAAVVEMAANRFSAARAIFVWSDSEEPWTYIARFDHGTLARERHDPGRFEPAISPAAGPGPFLFDHGRGRILARGEGRKRVARRLQAPIRPALAAEFGADRGVRIPVRSASFEGELLLLDVPGLCSDDLQLAEDVARQVAATLDDNELFAATEEAAAIRARLSLARDLHDSIVQFLAGLAFRLEGVKQAAAAGRGISDEIDELQRDLAGEQKDLRHFIAGLRGDPAAHGYSTGELAGSLRQLTSRIAAQWGVSCDLVAAPAEITVPPALEQNVWQLVREAIANAVRHGGATEIETRLASADGMLELEIRDNGRGFPLQGEFGGDELRDRSIGPASLCERVENLRGSLRLASSPAGSTLSITLPLGAEA